MLTTPRNDIRRSRQIDRKGAATTPPPSRARRHTCRRRRLLRGPRVLVGDPQRAAWRENNKQTGVGMRWVGPPGRVGMGGQPAAPAEPDQPKIGLDFANTQTKTKVQRSAPPHRQDSTPRSPAQGAVAAVPQTKGTRNEREGWRTCKQRSAASCIWEEAAGQVRGGAVGHRRGIAVGARGRGLQ